MIKNKKRLINNSQLVKQFIAFALIIIWILILSAFHLLRFFVELLGLDGKIEVGTLTFYIVFTVSLIPVILVAYLISRSIKASRGGDKAFSIVGTTLSIFLVSALALFASVMLFG